MDSWELTDSDCSLRQLPIDWQIPIYIPPKIVYIEP